MPPLAKRLLLWSTALSLAACATAPASVKELAVAEAKTESVKARRAADEVSAASRALREEIGRKTP